MKCNLFFINATLFLIRCTVYLLSQKCFYYIKNLINLKSWVTTAEFGAFVVAHSFPDQGKKENVNSISTTNKPRSRMCVFTFSIEKHSYGGGRKSRKFPFSLPFVSCKINVSPRVRSCWESVLSRAPPQPIGMDHHLCQHLHCLGDEPRAYHLHLYISLFEFPSEALLLFCLSLLL